MKRFISPLICSLSLAFCPPCSGQLVMDFSTFSTFSDLNYVFSPVIEDGISLSHFYDFQMWGSNHQNNSGRKALQNRVNNTPIVLTMENGSLFTLTSIRLFPIVNYGSVNVTFIGNKPGGATVSATFSTGTSISGVVRTFPPEFSNLASVTWQTTAANLHQFDDITVVPGPEINSPPAITVSEATGSASLTVSISAANPASDLSLPYTTSNGTALNGSDFNIASSGTVTIPAGQTSTSLDIPILNDTDVEPLENFTVSFTAGQAVVSTVSIASDDGINTFAGWMSNHGLTGNSALPNADPNGDGISNIETWLHRINPAGPSPAAWLNRRATYVTATGNVPTLRFTVPRPLPADVRMIFEETTSLDIWSEQTRRTGFNLGSSWTGSGASRVTETSSINENMITLPASQSVNSRPNAFLRMKYELSSGGGSRD